jgi:hypothetical protein
MFLGYSTYSALFFCAIVGLGVGSYLWVRYHKSIGKDTQEREKYFLASKDASWWGQ